MSLTVSTSWPASRLTVIGVIRCAESATATARWRISSPSSSGSLAAASGWCGATANTNSIGPRSFIVTPGGSSRLATPPIARSAWPVISASQVPASTSVRRRRRVAGGVGVAAAAPREALFASAAEQA